MATEKLNHIVVHSIGELSQLKPETDVVIVNSAVRDYDRVVLEVRGSDKAYVRLIPMLLLGTHAVSEHIHARIDGVIPTLDDLEHQFERIQEIKEKVASLNAEVSESSYELSALIKTLRFLSSRGFESIKPVRERSVQGGYTYPILSIHATSDTFELLTLGEREGLFEREHFDINYICPNCSDSYLHYRETCKSCDSTNLESQDLVHHFPCAYMGPESDFKTEDKELTCPKCRKDLNHIGIDFDRPSEIHLCHSCGTQSQNMPIKAHCQGCGVDHFVEDLKKRAVSAYNITSIGYHVAKTGVAWDNMSHEAIEDDNVVPYATFTAMVGHEIKLLKAVNTESCISALRITPENQETISESLLGEICKIIKADLRPSDAISIDNESEIVILHSENTLEASQKKSAEIKDEVIELLVSNHKHAKYAVEVAVASLMPDLAALEQINKLQNSL